MNPMSETNGIGGSREFLQELVLSHAGEDLVDQVGLERAREIISICFFSDHDDPTPAIDEYLNGVEDEPKFAAIAAFAWLAVEYTIRHNRPEIDWPAEPGPQ